MRRWRWHNTAQQKKYNKTFLIRAFTRAHAAHQKQHFTNAFSCPHFFIDFVSDFLFFSLFFAFLMFMASIYLTSQKMWEGLTYIALHKMIYGIQKNCNQKKKKTINARESTLTQKVN